MSRPSTIRHPSAAAGLATLLLGATAVFATTAAPAADLDDDRYERGYGTPYDDPRYADIYRHPPPRAEVYGDDRHYGRSDDDDDDDDDDDRPPHRYGGRGEYLPPMRDVPRFAGRDRYADDRCVPRHVVKRRLRADGWHDFHDLELGGATAFVRARRPSGRLFELEVHRCSGEIVQARPFGPRAYGARRYPSRS